MTTVQRKLLHLFLLGMVAALAVGFVLRLLGKREQRVVEKRAAERVLPDGLAVERLSWTTPESAFELEREGEAWQLVAPVETRAEDATVEALVRHLQALERKREVGRKGSDGSIVSPTKLWLYGLEPPRFTVALWAAEGPATVLRVGKKNHFDGSLYVMVEGAPEVMQVDGALEYQVDKNLYQLRDKRLLPVAAKDVARLVVARRGAEGFTVVREPAGFFLLEPRRAADAAQVEGMLAALTHARAQAFVSERATPEEHMRFGLDRPLVRITVSLTDGGEHELWLTRQSAGKTLGYYGTRAGQHAILRFGSAWVWEKVDVEPRSLWDRHLLRFARDQVRRLTLIRGEDRLVFARRREAGSAREAWRILEPIEAAADDAMLASLLFRVGALEAKQTLDEKVTAQELAAAGLDAPDVVIEVAGDEGSLGSVAFAAADGDEIRAFAGERIDLVDGAFFDELSFVADDYRAP